MRRAGCFFVVLVLTWPAGRSAAENWPGWRGPKRNGVSDETDLPLKWSARQGVVWKADLPGVGTSNPIVWDDRVYVTAALGPKQDGLHLVCLGRDDGRQRWDVRLEATAPTPDQVATSTTASPSPATDGRRVFAFFGTGDLLCVDRDGRELWRRSLRANFGVIENRHAAASSPLLYHGLLILQCDHAGASYLLAVDQGTGADRWKVDRPEAGLSWSSPQLAALAEGGEELIVCGSQKVDGYDPETGQKHWTVEGMSRECVPTPVIGHGLIFAVSGPSASTLAIKPGGHGDVTKTHVVWRNPRGVPFVPSGILVGDYYYMVHDKGIGTCLDAHTGKVKWRKRLGTGFTASPVAGDGKVYFCDDSGTTVVLASGTADYRELARNRLDEPIFTSPAISQGRILLRTTGHLYCVGR